MRVQSRGGSTEVQPFSRRQARALRILDATAALTLRWGYHKVTLDDIARRAGVAKGTLYLHWKSREALFAALLQREKGELVQEIKRHMQNDPVSATLQGVLKYTALALLQRPLLKAVLLNDPTVLGNFVRREHRSAAFAEELAGFTAYLALLREQDLVRTDLSLRAQVYLVSALFVGFFAAAPLIPGDFGLADEELADLLAETVHRTLEVDRAISSDTSQTITHAFLRYLNHLVAPGQEPLPQGGEA